MACQKCGVLNILSVNAKCSDMCSITLNGVAKPTDGYVPKDLGIGGGDYIEFKLCLSCGQIQDSFPKILSFDDPGCGVGDYIEVKCCENCECNECNECSE